jgi:hypothetical protein
MTATLLDGQRVANRIKMELADRADDSFGNVGEMRREAWHTYLGIRPALHPLRLGGFTSRDRPLAGGGGVGHTSALRSKRRDLAVEVFQAADRPPL